MKDLYFPTSQLENRPMGHFVSDAGRQVPLKKSKLECLRLESEGGVSLRRGGRSSCRADRKKSEDRRDQGGARKTGRIREGEKPGLVMHTCEPSTWMAEAVGLPLVQGRTGHSEILTQKPVE